MRSSSAHCSVAVSLLSASLLAVVGFSSSVMAQASLDVVGIKLGMSVNEATAALKADNPRMLITPSTFTLEGFPNVLTPALQAVEGGENVVVTLSLVPGKEAVWGVKRQYSYQAAEQPSLQNTLDALHTKYGMETAPADPDPRNATKSIAWVYDAQGRPMGPRGAPVIRACENMLLTNFGSEPQSSFNDISGGKQWPPECSSVTLVRASVQATRDPANSQMRVFNLIVSMADGARYRSSIDATRAVALRAAEERQKKQNDDVNKRGAPKL